MRLTSRTELPAFMDNTPLRKHMARLADMMNPTAQYVRLIEDLGPSAAMLRLLSTCIYLLDCIIDLTAILAFQRIFHTNDSHDETAVTAIAGFAWKSAWFRLAEHVCHRCMARFPAKMSDRDAEMLHYGKSEDEGSASMLAEQYMASRLALILALAVMHYARPLSSNGSIPAISTIMADHTAELDLRQEWGGVDTTFQARGANGDREEGKEWRH